MPSDIFKYVPAGQAAAPGTCRVCGSEKRDLIDTGLWFEYEGAVLFCTDCIMEIVNVDELKIMRQADAVNLMVENERLMKRDKAMKQVRKDLRSALVAVADNIEHRISYSTTKSIVVGAVPTANDEGSITFTREDD